MRAPTRQWQKVDINRLKEAYIDLLRHPMDEWRIMNQQCYNLILDVISDADEEFSRESIQAHSEEAARVFNERDAKADDDTLDYE